VELGCGVITGLEVVVGDPRTQVLDVEAPDPGHPRQPESNIGDQGVQDLEDCSTVVGPGIVTHGGIDLRPLARKSGIGRARQSCYHSPDVSLNPGPR